MKYLKYFENLITYQFLNLITLGELDIPEYIDGDFNCSNNELTSLEFGPEHIGGDFCCINNKLKSLKHIPSYIGGNIHIGINKLKNLKYCPVKIYGFFNCYDNKLKSLEFSPENINGYFNCSKNNITSLEFCPKYVGGDFDCENNKLTALDFLPEYVDGNFMCDNNPWSNPIPFELIKKFKISTRTLYTTNQQIYFSSYEYQKEFLTEKPEKYKDLEYIGYNKKIKEEFDWLFNASDMGLM